MPPGEKNVHAFWLFFPAASVLAAIAVPLSIRAVLSGTGWPSGLTGAGHGHELIFGFALALIAGYTLGPQPRRILLPLFALWLLARVSWLLAPDTALAQLLSPAFALALARYAVPRFSAAKKWRNKAAAPLILLLCLLAVGFLISRDANRHLPFSFPDAHQLMQSAILGLLMLMTFIGGRVIAPAVAGTLEKQGIPLKARVQPHIEGTLILLLSASVALSLVSAPALLIGFLLLATAVGIIIRSVRWKLWLCRKRPDLLVLAAGYLWLAIGAGMTGLHLLAGASPVPALHLITIGALGTLSTSVMLRLAWQRSHRMFPPAWQALTSGAAIATSAISRYLAGPTPFNEPGWLWLSSSLWSLAFLGVAVQLLMLAGSSKNRRK
ncbi:NnrS family protein [Marinobacter sp. F4206]|uniref:NnrS family protein n=1 Tax=Marinobacter sp. F4206 TaxID=2861777 RepID=UPI001C5FD069|nr:NnrS family protein [Marinobacter sp. F4206]MBW4934313.1 NnrS family protein [Marinobacter sp. F4206]